MSRYASEAVTLWEALQRSGQVVTLRRRIGAENVDIETFARVRSPSSRELAAGISQTVSRVIVSPVPLIDEGWTDGQPPSYGVEPNIPKPGDKIIIAGRQRNIEHVNPYYVDNKITRIELQVTG